MYFSPKTANDGLVFHYDTGNTVRSYKGEPTTNVLNNNILGTGNGAFLSSDSTGTYIQLANLTSSYSRFQLPSIPVSSNDTYTWSFELMSPETITTNYYFDTNEYSDQFPASNDLSRASATARVPSTMPAGVWQQFSLTVTMKPDLTGAYTYDFFNMLYPTFQNKKIYYRNMQFEFKDHPTQYAGQGVTRSATQGLLDLTGRSIANLSNVSFDASAQIRFDGTDDYIEVPDDIYLRLTTDMSFEFVVYADSTQSNLYPRLIDKSNYLVHLSQTAPFSIAQNVNTSSGLRQVAVGSAFEANTWTHIITTYDGQVGKVYVNSKLVATNDWGSVLGATTSGTSVRIGGDGFTSRPLNGLLPVTKIYNRALTADEVKRNFTAIRSRFNI